MNPVRLAALLIVGAGTVLTIHAAAPVDGSFAAAQLLKNAKSYSLEVEQHFVEASDTTLPFVDAVNALMKSAGIAAEPADTATLRVRISAEGRALARRYSDQRQTAPRAHYSGAELTGWWEFTTVDGKSARVEFSARREPPLNISQAYDEPAQAPFAATFGGFVQAFTKTVALAHGAQPMIAILRATDNEDFFYTVPQLQWCAAAELAHSGSAEAKGVLIEALQSFSPHRQAGGARGLRLLGANDALPLLIGALNTVESELPEDLEHDGRWQAMTHHERAFDSYETDGGFLEPWSEILGTIASLTATDKTGPLLAVMRNDQSALARMGAALLLGRERDARAYNSLLNAAKADTHPLVRLAAISALGELRDQRAVTELRNLVRTAALPQEKTAVRRAIERLAPATVAGSN